MNAQRIPARGPGSNLIRRNINKLKHACSTSHRNLQRSLLDIDNRAQCLILSLIHIWIFGKLTPDPPSITTAAGRDLCANALISSSHSLFMRWDVKYENKNQ